jgi:signal peptidase I
MKNFRKHLKEWGKAFLWAFLVAWFVRTLLIQGAFIPSQSMERTLLPGDFVFINKWSYGPRMPITPLAIPFMHQNMPFSNSTPAYLDWVTLPYWRIPGFGDIERQDVVVFNYPMEQERPVDKRTYFVKRCVALPGDSLRIDAKQVFINGKPQNNLPDFQFLRRIKCSTALDQQWLDSLDITEGGLVSNMLDYEFPLTDSIAKVLEKHPFVHSMSMRMEAAGDYQAYIFPHSRNYLWNNDHWGPIQIPFEGQVITLNDTNIVLYERIIREYEHNELSVAGGKFYINNQAVTTYTIQQDYYFMMGDNRDYSADSRSWGFVPRSHVIGKAWLIFFSYNASVEGKSHIRWNRIFRFIE